MRGPLLAVALQGCIEFGIDPIDDTDPPEQLVAVTESFVQQPLPAVDLLFVVDDTASMAQEQADLAANFEGLVQALDAAGVAWQVGVLTTDMSGADAGWLEGSPYVLTPATPDVAARFADVVQVGTDGQGPEAGLAAADAALRLAGADGPNAGFRRPDAGLHVVFVSDADDASDAWLGADPVAAFLTTLEAEAEATGLPAYASGFVGDVPGGCISDRGTAQPGARYQQVIGATGGVAVSICSTDLGPLVEAVGDVAVRWPTVFPLREVPVEGSVRVTVAGEVLQTGWTLDPQGPAVVFDEAPAPSVRIEIAYLVANR